MPYDTALWEEIRVLWVTGEQQEAKDKFYQLSKNKMLSVVLAAIASHWRYAEPHVHDGSLTDLSEIILDITRGAAHD